MSQDSPLRDGKHCPRFAPGCRDSRISIRVPGSPDTRILVVYLEFKIWYSLSEPIEVSADQRLCDHACCVVTYLIPAAIPLKPAPTTMTLKGRYSSIEKSPSSKSVTMGWSGRVLVLASR